MSVTANSRPRKLIRARRRRANFLFLIFSFRFRPQCIRDGFGQLLPELGCLNLPRIAWV